MCGSQRYGLIGRNGEGKSSLLRILPEFAPPGMRIHVVHQEAEGSETQSALEAVVAADTGRTELLDEQAKLEASDDPADLKRLEEISVVEVDVGDFFSVHFEDLFLVIICFVEAKGVTVDASALELHQVLS